MATETKERKFLIRRKAPVQVKLSDFGIPEDANVRNREFYTSFHGTVSIREFRLMFGEEAKIVNDLIHWASSSEHFTTEFGIEEVLACEKQESSMQHVLINALRRRGGLDELTGEQTSERGLDYDNLSPEVAVFLMQMYDSTYKVEDVDLDYEVGRFDEQGFRPEDLYRLG